MKKVIALVLTLAMMCCMLVSCDNAEALIKKADAALLTQPYKMTLSMDFTSDNEEFNELLSVMSMDIPVMVDGTNIAMSMTMNAGELSMDTDVRVVDKVMYYHMTWLGQHVKLKCTLNEEQLLEFAADNGAEMPVTPEDFARMTVESKDGKKYIACGEITDEGIEALNDMLADMLESLGAEASYSDVTYEVVLADGKYESMKMSCTYTMTVGGQTSTLKMDIGATFDYSAEVSVTAPEDPEAYAEANYDEIIGIGG